MYLIKISLYYPAYELTEESILYVKKDTNRFSYSSPTMTIKNIYQKKQDKRILFTLEDAKKELKRFKRYKDRIVNSKQRARKKMFSDHFYRHYKDVHIIKLSNFKLKEATLFKKFKEEI